MTDPTTEEAIRKECERLGIKLPVHAVDEWLEDGTGGDLPLAEAFGPVERGALLARALNLSAGYRETEPGKWIFDDDPKPVQTPSAPAAPAIGQPGSVEAKAVLEALCAHSTDLEWRRFPVHAVRALLRTIDEQAATIREAVDSLATWKQRAKAAEAAVAEVLPALGPLAALYNVVSREKDGRLTHASVTMAVLRPLAAFVSKHKEPSDAR